MTRFSVFERQTLGTWSSRPQHVSCITCVCFSHTTVISFTSEQVKELTTRGLDLEIARREGCQLPVPVMCYRDMVLHLSHLGLGLSVARLVLVLKFHHRKFINITIR